MDGHEEEEEESVTTSEQDLDAISKKNNENINHSESDKLVHCFACGSTNVNTDDSDSFYSDNGVVIKSENLTDDDDNNDKSDDFSSINEQQPKKEKGEENVNDKTKRKKTVFLNFCGLLGVQLAGTKFADESEVQTSDGESAGENMVPVFCQICRNQLALLTDLREKLKELERDLDNGIQEFKKMCQKAEEKFQGSQVYKQEDIYMKIRKQIWNKQPAKGVDQKIKKDNKRLKCTRSSTKMQSPLNTSVQHEDVCIKVEPELAAFDENNEVHDKVDFDDLNSSPFEDYHCSEDDDEDEYVPPKKVRRPPPAKKRKKLGRPPKLSKKQIPTHNNKKKRDLSSAKTVNRQSLTRKSRTKRDKEYFISDDNGEENDSEEDIEASLRGRMTTDPTTGHVIFLNVSFEALSSGRYRCLTCEKDSAYHRGSLKKHVITMHTSMFVCQECDQHCPSSKSLNSHVRRVHRGQDRKTVECKICGKPCSSKRGRMEKHMGTHLSAQEKQEAKARGEEIPQWSKLRRHVCDQCGRGYELKSHLIQHKIREHPSTDYTDEEKVACKEMCPDCGKLVHRHYLKKHQEFVHSEGLTKRFSCMLCEKRFAKESDLRKHKNVVHEKIKPFKCTMCTKQFALKTQLNYHLQTHQNIRPFACNHCVMAFARKHHLERHLRIYHEPGANPKRKTYVKGPETKAKYEMVDEQVTRESIIQVCGMVGRQQQEESSQFSTEGEHSHSAPSALDMHQHHHPSQQQQVTWLGHQST